MIERKQLGLVRSNIANNYERFSGRTLEQYFQAKAFESGLYTQVGNWWDRKGENEIDLIALNEFNHTAVAAEIKRNSEKINLHALEAKVETLRKSDFGKYSFSLQALSLEDM